MGIAPSVEIFSVLAHILARGVDGSGQRAKVVAIIYEPSFGLWAEKNVP